jgi:hypothetical protein
LKSYQWWQCSEHHRQRPQFRLKSEPQPGARSIDGDTALAAKSAAYCSPALREPILYRSVDALLDDA